MRHNYRTQMVCSTQISFDLNGDVVSNVAFTGATESLQPGHYPLVTATDLDFGGEWACASPRVSRTAFLRVSGNTVTLLRIDGDFLA